MSEIKLTHGPNECCECVAYIEAENKRLQERLAEYQIVWVVNTRYREALEEISRASDAEEFSETPEIAKAALEGK